MVYTNRVSVLGCTRISPSACLEIVQVTMKLTHTRTNSTFMTINMYILGIC